MEGRRLILLFMQDISRQQQWEALGRVFFHDLTNIIYGLVGNAEMLLDKAAGGDRALVRRIHRLSLRLAREVQMQKHLTQMADADYRPAIQAMSVGNVFDEMEAAFASHPAAHHRTVDFAADNRGLSFKSDFFLVVRVLTNMITNALEATDKGRSVKVWATSGGNRIVFHVWNHQAIPENVAGRIFQRNISTKAASGRGLGTYSMKLFGENFLEGAIDFTTAMDTGTTFRFSLPLSPDEDEKPLPARQPAERRHAAAERG
ncbi:MAG TPA: HAMP domain-containing sensor histidine kinase [Desulfosarcina sp.]|nr:HAMP domain-containing sensor histidine kinase [Desulfosarcina sp.]